MVAIGPLSSLFDYLTFGALVWLFDGLNDRALFQTCAEQYALRNALALFNPAPVI
jgi:hypothetical protein